MDNYLKFPVTVYSQLQTVSPTISLARCRIFYKGRNRNGSFITDEFAEKLVASLPYTPVKGIYEVDDYTDHGKKRSDGRIYGVVPETNNFAWEEHTDEDGVTRTYACTDVFLYTALYKEASEILGKPQSMEIYEKSIKGQWEIKDGQRVYVFTDGYFLGLQALGDETEPCFEGAAFFSLYSNLVKAVQTLEKSLNFSAKKEEQKDMPDFKFKLSDDEKESAIWSLLNPNFTEEGNWTLNEMVCAVYDEYAICRNTSDGKYSRAYYTKDDSTDSLTIDKTEPCFIVDVNEEEKAALDTLHALKGTYAEAAQEYTIMVDAKQTAETKLQEVKDAYELEKKDLNEKISDFEIKVSELTDTNATLTTEKENFTTQIAQLTAENKTLSEYKEESEKAQKESIISRYSKVLSKDIIKDYTDKMSDYTVKDLEKELAFTLVQNNESIFTGKETEVKIPTGGGTPSSLEAVLSQYKKH